jgi:hypothetical protein
MATPAAEVYRVERSTGYEPRGRKSPVVRALGTALTGLPMPKSKLTWDATLRIVDDKNEVVYETSADEGTIDALELQILQDLMRLDVEAFRGSYGLPDPDA